MRKRSIGFARARRASSRHCRDQNLTSTRRSGSDSRPGSMNLLPAMGLLRRRSQSLASQSCRLGPRNLAVLTHRRQCWKGRMPSLRLPAVLKRAKLAKVSRDCPAHRAWVRKHKCSVPACDQLPIECAHVRRGTDGGMGLKPSDSWCISLCTQHHAEQHRIGEGAFEKHHGVDLVALAQEFVRRSPHWRVLALV